MRPVERAAIITTLTVLAVVTFVTFVALLVYEEPQPYKTQWAPPEIPVCDRPTWERITEGCDD